MGEEYLDPQVVLDRVIQRVGGSPRTGQQEMVSEIGEAIASHSHRVIQAGTGTGKSLGYLVPAATHAITTSDPVIVSTATLALQKQLMDKDLPVLAEALSENFQRDLKFAVLKGRNNYVCLQKLHASVPDPDDDVLFEVGKGTLGAQAVAVRAWAEETTTGDRDDFGDDIDPRVWKSFSVSRRECIGESKCAFGEECFTAKRREAAADAHIVVTNHALLSIDVIEGIPVLPEHSVVVIDEGHEIVDRATSAVTSELSVAMVERATSRVHTLIDQRTADLLADAQGALDIALRDTCDPGDGPTRLNELSRELLLGLTLVRDASHAAVTEIGSLKSDDPEASAKNQRARGAMEEIHDLAGAIISADNSLVNDSVLWIDHAGRPPALHCAPLSVAHLLHGRLFEEKCVVVTSATLTTSGTFDSITHSLGIHNDSRAKTVDVGSPFDYPRQGIIYVAAHLPAPSRDGIAMEALDEMGELIEAAGGRTLVLCSSWRTVERAAEYLRVRCDTPLHVQKKGESVGLLVDRFASDEHSSLIGTLSLWQGVDVPGVSCSQVIIDRIPFPRPDDPVMSARSRAVDEAGGSGFSSVMVTRAGLMLAQGAGRLIRQTSDRGVVSVLDPRVATAGYGKALRASMPPLWFTTSKETTIAALARLHVQEETAENSGDPGISVESEAT